MMKNNGCTYGQSEDSITYIQNNCEPVCKCNVTDDQINVRNLKGELIGYNWNYGDTITLTLNLNETILHTTPDRFDIFKVYLTNKDLELTFKDIRGYVKYTFKKQASLITKFDFNTDETNTIGRNTYKISAKLIDRDSDSILSLFKSEYIVYVK